METPGYNDGVFVVRARLAAAVAVAVSALGCVDLSVPASADNAGMDAAPARDGNAREALAEAPDMAMDVAAELADLRDAGTDAPAGDAPPILDLTRGLVAFWRFDEPPGSLMAEDSSGNRNTGEVRGSSPGQRWVGGRIGGAFDLPPGSSSKSWIRVPASRSFDSITGGLTMSVWTYRTAHQAGSCTIASRQAGITSREHYNLYLTVGTPGVLLNDQTNAGLRLNAPAQLPLDQWVHLAFTFDGSAVRLYVQGNQVAQAAHAISVARDTSPFTIGGELNDATDNIGETYFGRLDELMLYNRALPPAEIAALASGARP